MKSAITQNISNQNGNKGVSYLTKKELLEQDAADAGVKIEHIPFVSDRIKGIYCNGNIAINKSIKEPAEESCVLAEELGHYYTSTGDILDLNDVRNRKQELKARMWAYNQQIGLMGLVRAFEQGCRTLNETAEYLDVTEQFLAEALERYQQKYGICTTVDNYIVYFEPNLRIGKMI